MVKKDRNDFPDKNWEVVLYASPMKVDEKYWFPYVNVLYSYDVISGEIKREHEFDFSNEQYNAYCYSMHIGRNIVLSPFRARDIAVYDMETHKMKFLEWENQAAYTMYRDIASFGDKLFLLPGIGKSDILVLDGLQSVRPISLINWDGNTKGDEWTSEYAIQDKYLWITAHYSNQVLKMDMDTEQYELVTICEESAGYTGIVIDNEYLWLAESSTGAFVRYNTQDGRAKKFDAPVGLDYNSADKSYVHLSLFNFEKSIISIPALCGSMTILDKETGNLDIVDIDFFDSIADSKANYKYGNYTTSSFGKKIDETTLWVQRALDGEIACIDIGSLTYTTFCLELDKEELDDIRARLYRSGELALAEDRLTSLSSMLNFLKDTDENVSRQSFSNIGVKIWEELK